MTQQTPTFADFNPTNDERVKEIKSRTDEVIALVRSYEKDLTNEGMKRAAYAIKDFENGAMWAVKALFSR